MRALVLVGLILLSSLCGCSKQGEQDVTPMEAKSIANSRYMVYAKMLNVNLLKVPSPSVEYRGQDTVFVYIVPTTTKKVTVIVDRSGEVADTVEPLSR